jgi:hypothetical protein
MAEIRSTQVVDSKCVGTISPAGLGLGGRAPDMHRSGFRKGSHFD